ncbi:MAG: endo-1,4-beta-xylanase [Phenylobacterium sp.]
MTGAPTRRDCLALGAAAVLAGAAAPAGSLDELARAKGLRFGSAIGAAHGMADPRNRAVIAAQCGLVVPENELKLYALKPKAEPGYQFAGADAIVAFAKANGMLFRGHTLLWNRNEFAPKWILGHDFGGQAAAERWFTDYIAAVAGRYAGAAQSWDVVNESIDPKTGEMRDTVFTRQVGPELLEIAFHAARAAAPKAKLLYNDYMGWGPGDAKHRAGVLRLLERLKAKGAPIDAFGVQGHIANGDAGNVIGFPAADQREWRRFIDEVRGMGLDILITEFDVNDTVLPADPAGRDAIAAAVARDFLDVMLSYTEVKQLLSWGIVYRYSWLQTWWPRPDHIRKRPTLYDEAFQPKPLREAVAAASRAAPGRTPWA